MAQLEAQEAVRTAQNDSEVAAAEAKERTRKFLSAALDRWHQSSEHEAEFRRLMREDFRFSIGEQWPSDMRSQRATDGRPCLTMNHLKPAIKQVTNELRQQRPAIQINPNGNGATRTVADGLQGMCRHIEVNSDAEVAYDISSDHAVRGGRGWIRVLTEYLPGETFDQEIKIAPVVNPFSVYDDPGSEAPDGSDADFRFVIEDVPRFEFKAMYQDAAAADLDDMSSVGDKASEWATKEAVRVAEYFYREKVKVRLHKLKTGEVKKEADLSEEDKAGIVASRDYLEVTVKWAKITAVDILEERELPGIFIPLVPVYGDVLSFDGKKHVEGMVRQAKDPQRMYNFQCSAATEQVALAPKAPFIGAKGQFKSGEAMWKSLNTRNFPYLEYDAIAVGGQLAPPPQRNVVEPPIQATALLIKLADNDIKATTGIFDASLGERGPEQSGKAILARQKQGDNANYDFSDNLARSIRQVGRILLDYMPHVYDVPRVQRILNPDGSAKYAGIFDGSKYEPDEAKQMLAEEMQERNIQAMFDIGTGTYDVSVAVGPNFQSRRQEAAESIMNLVNAYPNLMQVAGDLMVANMDWPYAKEIAERLKKMLPPGLAEDGEKTPEQQVAELQQKLNAVMQQHQDLTTALEKANEIINTKQVESNAQVAIAKLRTEAQVAAAEITSKAQIMKEREAIVSDLFQKIADHAHELAMAKTVPQEGSEGQSKGGGEGAEEEPQASPSSFADGGEVKKGGKATVHAGERVLTKKENDHLKSGGSITVEGAIDHTDDPHGEIDNLRQMLEGKGAGEIVTPAMTPGEVREKFENTPMKKA